MSEINKNKEIGPKKQSMIEANHGLRRELRLLKMIMYFGQDPKRSAQLADFENTLREENENTDTHILDYIISSSDEKIASNEIEPLFNALVCKYREYSEAFAEGEETLGLKVTRARLQFDYELESDLYKMICWYISEHSNEYYQNVVNEVLGTKKEKYFGKILESIIDTALSYNDKIFTFRTVATGKSLGPEMGDNDLTLLTGSNDIARVNLTLIIQMMKMNLYHYYNDVIRNIIVCRYRKVNTGNLAYDEDQKNLMLGSIIGKIMFLLIQTATYINAVRKLGGTIDYIDLDTIILSARGLVVKSNISDASYIIPALDDITELAKKLANSYLKEFTK